MTGNNITRFDYPHGAVYMSQYGTVDFHHWLLNEQKRIATHGIKTRIIVDNKSREALVRI